MITFVGQENNEFTKSEDFFYQSGRLIKILSNDLFHMDRYLNKQSSYGILYDNPNTNGRS